MKINWLVGPHPGWAFYNFSKKIQDALPDFEHAINGDDADINLAVTIGFLRFEEANEKMVMRLSGRRVFENRGVHFEEFEKDYGRPTIGWWGGYADWAFKHLASHIKNALPEYKHLNTRKGDINIVLSWRQLTRMEDDVDKSFIMHIDGQRVFEERGVRFDFEPNDKQPIAWSDKTWAIKPRIVHLVWALHQWSWGVVYDAVQSRLSDQYDFEAVEFKDFRGWPEKPDNCFYFCQNVTQVAMVPEHLKSKTITRLGGNMNFNTGNETVNQFLRQMGNCGAVIATNNYLYQIGKMANPNTYLIPNGIDVDEWRPRIGRFFHIDNPRVGFIGNVKNKAKVQYKGYDLVTRVCRDLGLELKQALYQESQIPHDQMMEKFWYEIDVFILPTDGEGCSNSIMEALACGVPVITTREAGYHGEMLTHGENVIFVDKSIGSIKRALWRLIGNPDLFRRLSENGRQFAIEHHSIDIIAGQYREVFERHFK